MPQVTKASLLTQARDLLEKGWCQGAYARNLFGDALHYSSNEGVRWCISGANRRVSFGKKGECGNAIQKIIADLIGGKNSDHGNYGNVTEWNDYPGRTQAEVLSLVDKAIASPEAQELVEVA